MKIMQEIRNTNLIGGNLMTAILACVICVLVTSRVYAQDVVITMGDCSDGDSDNVTYTIYDTDGDSEADKLVISGSGKMAAHGVGSLPWEDYCNSIKFAVIEDGVTSIGDCAFDGCGKLTGINIPESVTSIGIYAFAECSNLTNISIPEGVTSIGQSAFYGCCSLTSINIPEGVTSIEDFAFENCIGLTSIDIPKSVTSIGASAFADCSGLTSINIPESVTSIGASAFIFCSSLTNINIPGSVTSIGDDTFKWCSGLTSINISEGVTSIGDYAFAGCSGLTGINIPKSATYIGYGAFLYCNFESVLIPQGVTGIGSRAFGYESDSLSGKLDGFVIKGYMDSTAQKYADDNGFTFVNMSSLSEDGHLTVYIPNASGWVEGSNGNKYWYENGYRMGYDAEDASYRGKEIYDEASDAWYWLDNDNQGGMAKSKDVYQESQADDEGTIGKWVRYDENGHMIKGWDENENGKYFFDYTYGTMVKGYYTVDGTEYYFDTVTGVLERTVTEGLSEYTGWKNVDGTDFWYEKGKRQGTKADSSYRGKEIFDPDSDAWYWLDNVDGGKKAVSKDVYQESQADDAGNIGKWVRYDANGSMIKGWSAGYGADARTIASASDANGDDVYYFDPTYGTMAKGEVAINGETYTFDTVSGVLLQ